MRLFSDGVEKPYYSTGTKYKDFLFLLIQVLDSYDVTTLYILKVSDHGKKRHLLAKMTSNRKITSMLATLAFFQNANYLKFHS